MNDEIVFNELKRLSDWISKQAKCSSDILSKYWNNSVNERLDGYSVISSLYECNKITVPETMKKILPYTVGITPTIAAPFHSISLVRDDKHLLFLLNNIKTSPVDMSTVMLSSFEMDLYSKAFHTVYHHIYDNFSRFRVSLGDGCPSDVDFILVMGTIHIVANLETGKLLKANSAIVNYCAPSYYNNQTLHEHLDSSRKILHAICSMLMK